MMRREIMILVCIVGISVFSCQNKVQNKGSLVIENESKIEISHKDTLKHLNFDVGLKVFLYRNLKDNSKHIVFLKNDSLITEKVIPSSLDYNGFSLDFLNQKGDYLLLATEHGSINYYQTTFYFSLSELTPFSLKKLRGKRFNKSSPDNWIERDSLLSTPLSIEKFNFEHFLDGGW